MARIRTIKPEFPQSESVGRLSRDARLLFIQLWTLCEDREGSRILASPRESSVSVRRRRHQLIDGWLEELEREDCIQRYTVDGSTYLSRQVERSPEDRPSSASSSPIREGSRICIESSRGCIEPSSGDWIWIWIWTCKGS